MAMRLKLKPSEVSPVGRRDIVQVLAALEDAELRALLDEARSGSLIPLAELVLEGLAPSVCALADRLGEGALRYDDIGRPCTTREVARGLRVGDRR